MVETSQTIQQKTDVKEGTGCFNTKHQRFTDRKEVKRRATAFTVREARSGGVYSRSAGTTEGRRWTSERKLMNNMTQPRFTKNEDYFLAVLNWPNGKIAIVFAVIFIAGVTYGVATKQGDIFDLVKDFGSCFWLAAYFNSLSISKSIINKIEKSLTDNKDVQAAA